MSDVSAFIQANAGALYDAVAFEQRGQWIKGKVTGCRVGEFPSMNGSNELEKVLTINLEVESGTTPVGKTGERRAPTPGEQVTVYARIGAMLNTIAGACSQAGVNEPEVGGELTVGYVDDAPAKAGKTGAKLFKAVFTRAPRATASPFDAMGATPTPDPFAASTAAPSTPSPFGDGPF